MVRRGDERGLKAVIAEKEGRGTRELKETVGARDPFGNTPLHYAAEGRHDIALLLLACGPLAVTVDARNNEGSTPLHQGTSSPLLRFRSLSLFVLLRFSCVRVALWWWQGQKGLLFFY